MTASIVLRRARSDEVDVLARLHARSWRATYGPMLSPEEAALLTVEERRLLWDRALGSPGPREAVWVAEDEDDGRVIGLLLVGPSHDQAADAATGEIHAIHVEPGRHREGIGGRLIAAAIDYLQREGFVRATLWVIRENDEARRFYEAKGWRPDGTEKRGPMGDFDGLPVVDEVRYARSLRDHRAR